MRQLAAEGGNGLITAVASAQTAETFAVQKETAQAALFALVTLLDGDEPDAA